MYGYIGIPSFQRPPADDTPINELQFNGQGTLLRNFNLLIIIIVNCFHFYVDVTGCNIDSVVYYTESCGPQAVLGDIFYTDQNR